MKRVPFKIKLKGKLILFVSAIIVLSVFIQFVQFYFTLNRVFDARINATMENFDTVIQTGVNNMVSVLQANYQQYLDGQITESEAMETAKKIVRDTRYNGGEGYYWADMADGTCAVHMNPEYEGTMRYDVQDLNGTYYIRNLITAGNQPEGGFTEFYFTKPGQEGAFQKRAFTQKFEPYGWYISTGNYYDDIDAFISQQLREKYIALIILVVSSIVMMVLGIVIVSVIANAITKPLGKVTDRLLLLSRGDLHTPVPSVNTQDETMLLAQATQTMVTSLQSVIGDITSHLNKMSGKDLSSRLALEYPGDFAPIRQALAGIYGSLNDALAGIRQSAEQVNSGAAQVSVGAQSLASGAAEQASAVEQLSASIIEVSGQAEKNSSNVKQATEHADESAEGVQACNRHMEQMLSSMEEIKNASSEINKIIKLINDIAFQTNILALNAAVEAARAGASGKGFAVVADEVRNLAGKSADAANQTTELIGTTVKAVAEGFHTAEDTATALETVSAKTKLVKDVMLEIENATVAQASAISQITRGIDQISSVVQTNAATAQESSASSEELSSQAAILQEEISGFRLADSGASMPSASTEPLKAGVL